MADQSITLYPGDTLEIYVSAGQAPEPASIVDATAPTNTATPTDASAAGSVVAGDGSTASVGAPDPTAGTVAEPAPIATDAGTAAG